MAMPAPYVLYGSIEPRYQSLPDFDSTSQARDCVEFAAKHGLVLDEWQEAAAIKTMATKGGYWAADEVGILCPRQNGKNSLLEARQLAGLYVMGEPLQIHTAHEFKAASEHFLRMQATIESNADLLSRVKRGGIRTSHGEEAILLRSSPTLIFGPGGRMVRKSVAPRLRFLARSRGSGRSFTCNTLYYDEAMILSQDEVDASMPTMSAVENHQMWFTASAGFPDSFQLAHVRKRGHAGTDPTLCFLEWCVEYCPELCPDEGRPRCRHGHDRRDDPVSWARANPSMNIRISQATIAKELTKMRPAGFDRERLGVGDWPLEDISWAVIPESLWNACYEEDWDRPQRLAVSVDITPDMEFATIAIAGYPPGSERIGVEIGDDGHFIDHRAGVQWILPRLKELKARYRGRMKLVIDPVGPGAELIVACERARIEVEKCTLRDVAQAHALFLRAVADRSLAHRGQSHLKDAVASGVQRDVGDGQHAWARRDTTEDISPLCAGTMAHWLAAKYGPGYDVIKGVAGPDTGEVPDAG